jgi:hypothetical protein
MKHWFALCCLLSVSINVRSQSLSPSEQSIKTAADNCMSRVSNGKADDAFSVLLSEYWKDKSTSPQATASMQRQYREVMQRVEDTMGKPVPGGYEFIGVKRLGTSVVKLVYLQKNELFFLPWAFSFYRAGSEWRLTLISFPDVGSDDMKDFIISDPSNQKR